MARTKLGAFPQACGLPLGIGNLAKAMALQQPKAQLLTCAVSPTALGC